MSTINVFQSFVVSAGPSEMVSDLKKKITYPLKLCFVSYNFYYIFILDPGLVRNMSAKGGIKLNGSLENGSLGFTM